MKKIYNNKDYDYQVYTLSKGGYTSELVRHTKTYNEDNITFYVSFVCQIGHLTYIMEGEKLPEDMLNILSYNEIIKIVCAMIKYLVSCFEKEEAKKKREYYIQSFALYNHIDENEILKAML